MPDQEPVLRSTCSQPLDSLVSSGMIVYMSSMFSRICTEALQLSEQDREILESEIWSGLYGNVERSEGIDAAWDSEIASRMQDIGDGKVEGIPYDQVEAHMRAKFPWLQ